LSNGGPGCDAVPEQQDFGVGQNTAANALDASHLEAEARVVIA
jgi:hypothetical protein